MSVVNPDVSLGIAKPTKGLLWFVDNPVDKEFWKVTPVRFFPSP